jgi:hypothetical protein
MLEMSYEELMEENYLIHIQKLIKTSWLLILGNQQQEHKEMRQVYSFSPTSQLLTSDPWDEEAEKQKKLIREVFKKVFFNHYFSKRAQGMPQMP